MFRNTTIRTALTVTIAGYTAALVFVIVTSIAGLDAANVALKKMYTEQAVALRHLAASGEAILQVRIDLGSYETLIAQGKPTDAVLARVHTGLADSDRELAAYLTQPPSDDVEKGLADALRARREQLMKHVLAPEVAALDQNDFITFRTTERQAPDSVFSDYKGAQLALENVQVQQQKARFESAQQHFQQLRWLFGAIGFAAVALGLFARFMVTASIMRPINAAIQHFERIAAGDLTGQIASVRANEMGRLMGALARMQEGLVAAVSQVRHGTAAIADSVREIASGNADLSTRKSRGIEQINRAVTQMDNVTQQNAALVEQAPAAAASLENQAGALDDAVAVFRLQESRQPPGEESHRLAWVASDLSTLQT